MATVDDVRGRNDPEIAMSFRETLGAQHRACDARLVEAERAVQRGDWAAATQRAQRFVDDTEAHFGFEELTLFPALAEAQPGAAAPIDAPVAADSLALLIGAATSRIVALSKRTIATARLSS